MSDEQPVPRLDLRCPYCGGILHINTEWSGDGYGGTDVPESIECWGVGVCGAEWETDGTLRTLPSFIRLPDLYDPPEGYSPSK